MNIVRHFQALPLTDPGQAPLWVQLTPSGPFRGVDGRGPFLVKNAAAVIAASMQDSKLPLDENHSTDLAAPMGAPSPAVGWIVELQAREDGIWGRMDWNASGKQLMADRAYRGISPVFLHAPNGNEITQIMRAALTNTPNISTIRSIHAQEIQLDLTKLRAALGLPGTADEAAILATVEANRTALAMHAANIAAIAAAAGAKSTDATALVAELQAARGHAGDVQIMAAKVVALETELNTMKAAGARQAATAFVDAAITGGKPIAALRDHYISRHMADAASVEKEIGMLVSINAGGMAVKPQLQSDSADDEVMSAEEMAVCDKMGLDKKAFVKQRNAMRKKKAA